ALRHARAPPRPPRRPPRRRPRERGHPLPVVTGRAATRPQPPDAQPARTQPRRRKQRQRPSTLAAPCSRSAAATSSNNEVANTRCADGSIRQAGMVLEVYRSNSTGFLCDPAKVVGIPVCDRPRRDTRYLVRVLPLCSGHDLGNPAAAGVQRHPALAALVNFAAPSVDRLDG